MASYEKFGALYTFEDEGDSVTVLAVRPSDDPDDLVGRIVWPSSDLLSLYHALGDFLMFSSRAEMDDLEPDNPDAKGPKK